MQTTSLRVGYSCQTIAQVAMSDVDTINYGFRNVLMTGPRRNAVGEL